MKKGLLCPFPCVSYWNFYEWSKGLDGDGPYCENFDCSKPDVILNSLLSIALQNLGFIADTLGIDNTYKHYAEELNFHIYDVFYDENTRLCYVYPEHKAYSQLGNALAILCGTIDGEKATSTMLEASVMAGVLCRFTITTFCYKMSSV